MAAKVRYGSQAAFDSQQDLGRVISLLADIPALSHAPQADLKSSDVGSSLGRVTFSAEPKFMDQEIDIADAAILQAGDEIVTAFSVL